MRKLFAVLILILFFSCGKKKAVPDGILQPPKMQAVFWDFIRADVYSRDFIKNKSTLSDTTENIMLQNKIFAFYKINRQDFYKSYDYYINHPDLMNILIDSMLAWQNRSKLQKQFKFNRSKLPQPVQSKPVKAFK